MQDIIKYFGAGTANTANTTINTIGGNTNLQGNIIQIVNGIIGALAMVCVIVIIIGGVNYMTSAGDAGKVKKAKDTILYGVIGMAVCALSFAIVNFVISNILGS